MSEIVKNTDKAVTRKDSIEGLYRLSGLQHGMLFHGLFDSESGAYINQFKCDLIDPDLEIFNKCWKHLISWHSILRTVFYHDKLKMPVQCVFKDINLKTEVLDFRGLNSEDQSAAISEYENADIVKGFDFNNAPLMRIALIRLDEKRYRMILTYHHIILDGWSIAIMMVEFLNVYEYLILGKEITAPEADKFEDYIRYIERIDKKKEQAYWKNYLKEIETGSLLPFISKSDERNKGAGEYKSLYLEIVPEITERIQSYAKRNRITVNTIMQATWSYCLHRYTGSQNPMFGVIVSGRPDDLQRVEHRVGLYINPLPIHLEIKGDKKITEWLQDLQKDQVSSRQYQHTALHEIQNWTGIQGDMFDCLLTFENFPVSEVL